MILYFTKANLALRRSHVYNILKTAEALGRVSGTKVVIIAPVKVQAEREIILSKHNISSDLVQIISDHDDLYYKVVDEAEVLYWRDPKLYFQIRKLKKGHKKAFFEVHRMPRGWIEWVLWLLNFRLADGVVTITCALKKRLKKYHKNVVTVFGNAYDPELFIEVRNISQQKVREDLLLPQNETLIVYAGQTKEYRFNEIFEAIKDLPVKMAIIGVTDRQELQFQVQFFGLEKKILLIDRISRIHIPAYLLAADILCVPYIREEAGAFPVKIFEYMGAGKPIISFVNEPITEILRDGENALLVNPSTVGQWRYAFQRILKDKSFAKRIAHRAYKESNMYTWQKRAQKIYHIIQTS